MSVMSGVPRTETGACNVRWVLDEEVGHTYAQMAGTSRAIVSATVHLHVGDLDGDALHEAGHVLGLGHSSNPFHLMAETPRVSDFTPEELAVLAWIYAPSGK
jgi:predicted Zn-dependent protease